MRLQGYIEAIKENAFAIPIYGDGVDLYYHEIDSRFRIKGFYKASVQESFFKKLYSSTDFKKGQKGVVVFVGQDNVILFGTPEKAIKEIENYLSETTSENEYKFIKEEVNEVKKTIEDLRQKSRNAIDYHLKESFSNTLHRDNYFKELLDIENSLINSKPKATEDEDIEARNSIKNSIQEAILQNKSKEVLFVLFKNFLIDDDSTFAKILIDSEISNRFSEYLINRGSEVNFPIHMTLEESLKFRTNEIRNKLKSFNYQFHNTNWIHEFEKEPAYKRLGIDITTDASSLMKYSNTILRFDDTEIPQEKKVYVIGTNKKK